MSNRTMCNELLESATQIAHNKIKSNALQYCESFAFFRRQNVDSTVWKSIDLEEL